MEVFLEHYKKLNENPDAENIDNDDIFSNNVESNHQINDPFTTEEIHKFVKNLKNNKTCGFD
jgi:hypothetical protein